MSIKLFFSCIIYMKRNLRSLVGMKKSLAYLLILSAHYLGTINTILQAVLISLKLTGRITSNWFFVLLPTWGNIFIAIIGFFILLIAFFIEKNGDRE